jgi:hypothetical protein
VPFKANAARQHHIPRQRHRVTNWSEYDAALRQWGSLTVWFSDEAIAAWRAEPRTTRGGQPHYSALAIQTVLTLRAVFRLALRQTEGLIGSILKLLRLNLAVPDHSTLSRRAETLEVSRPVSRTGPVHLLVDSMGPRLCGLGEWLVEKHDPLKVQEGHEAGERIVHNPSQNKGSPDVAGSKLRDGSGESVRGSKHRSTYHRQMPKPEREPGASSWSATTRISERGKSESRF